MRYEYHITNHPTGLLVMFKVDKADISWDNTEDMGSDVEMLFVEDDGEWGLQGLSCGNPAISEFNGLLLKIVQYLSENDDVATLDDLQDFVKAIGTENTDIFSYHYSL